MSTIKVNAITDASGGNTATINSMTPTADSLQGFRNRIINGDMRIDQRNAGASVTPSNQAYTLDRWQCFLSGGGAYSVQQSSTAPAGFVNSLLVTTTTADSSIAAGDYYMLTQIIEGTNISDLAWGSASAKTVTLSFWVRSSLTGTFSGALNNNAANRSYPFSYTISAANTWEQKSVTITGDTAGTWLTTTGKGITLRLSLGMGSTYSGTANAWAAADYYATTSETAKVIGTLNATFYITGVQLEVGSTATPFERSPYTTQLQLCQRYFVSYGGQAAYEVVGTTGIGYSTTYAFSIVVPPVEMRATPTLTTTGTFNWSDYAVGNSTGALSISAGETSTKHIFIFSNGTASGITQYRPYMLIAANSTASRIGLSAEL